MTTYNPAKKAKEARIEAWINGVCAYVLSVFGAFMLALAAAEGREAWGLVVTVFVVVWMIGKTASAIKKARMYGAEAVRRGA